MFHPRSVYDADFSSFCVFSVHLFVKPIATGGMDGDTELGLSNSYTMGCPPLLGDNPRALASGLSYVQVDKHDITILYNLHQCRPCTSQDISC